MNNKGILYLIPSPLSDGPMEGFLPGRVFDVIARTDRYVVEEVRTARRFLSAAGRKGEIEGIEFHTLNEHTSPAEVEAMAALFDDGSPVGLISEAGLPAVADPGAALVALCHRIGVKVVPLVGPSSLMLALMGSGLNGQSFAFHGYLPAKTPQRRKALESIERTSAKLCQSQIFIETPYRNDAMLQDMLECLAPTTRLCIATDITAQDENIETKSIGEWKRQKTEIGKKPTVFIILA